MGRTPDQLSSTDGWAAPDVLLGSGIHFMDVFKILPDRPELRAYAERCRARPAFQRAAALESA